MSDFLSNFTKNNYDGQKKEPAKKPPEEPDEESKALEEQPQESVEKSQAEQSTSSQKKQEGSEETNAQEPPVSRRNKKEMPVSRYQTEETEFDPTFKKKQRKKYLLIAASSVLAAILLFVIYFQLTHVKVPTFVGKEISEVRTWGNEEKVLIAVEQEYDFDTAVNHVISQEIPAGKQIKKGKTLTIKASLGPDPEEKIELADFSKMDKTAASEWIEKQKAENISLIESYDDNIKKGEFIKQEAASKELNLAEYKRKDRLSVYYSKGKEVFEKDIEVPDFKGKPLTEVTEWAKKNEVKLKVEHDFSNDVLVDNVVSQETEKGQKIAKHEEIVLHVSKGKALEVADFSKYTMAEAMELNSPITTLVKSVFSDQVGYGRFLSQSVAAGEKYAESDDLPTVEVYYSQGKPYIQDLRGTTTEGDLPKLFFEEYQSKGAEIYYTVYYVDSAQTKGTVVEMSHYGQYLPMSITLSIGVSLGNLTPIEESIEEIEPASVDDSAPSLLEDMAGE